MAPDVPPIRFPTDNWIPPGLGPWAGPVEIALQRWIVPPELVRILDRAHSSETAAAFARCVLDELGIGFAVEGSDLDRIPRCGPTVIVANHPFGIAEGLILMALLDPIRKDFKIVANSLLSGIAAIGNNTVLVNPFETSVAVRQNQRPLRDCLRWLAGSGLLAMFPAGEVAHLRWGERSVTDPPWKTAAARLALRAKAPVVPVFFEGGNGLFFNLAGALHPGLRTLSLPREFGKMRHRTVHVRIGSAVPCSMLEACGDAARATEYLRSRAFFLSNRPKPSAPYPHPNLTLTGAGSIDLPANQRSLSEEVTALPACCELAGNAEFSVFLAAASQIPRLLLEIGRRREAAFRQVGEGTGKAADLDRFDEHYQHLFLWSKTDGRLAGAYRLALTTDVLRQFGIRGLYTSTLFRYKPRFFDRLGPAVELGRSFICPEYQKSYAPLLLLWKGITRFVLRHPEAASLFGAVSISRDYQEASRGLIASFLLDRTSHQLARLVQPRIKYREATAGAVRRMAAVAANIEDLSLPISDIESDGKGVPVLLRQYLKAGGRLLGLNVDPNFRDVVDALILTDLRAAPPALLERCMGRLEAKSFLEWHSSQDLPAAV
jgi:putative hemolysin